MSVDILRQPHRDTTGKKSSAGPRTPGRALDSNRRADVITRDVSRLAKAKMGIERPAPPPAPLNPIADVTETSSGAFLDAKQQTPGNNCGQLFLLSFMPDETETKRLECP